ncbi:MAG: hypothetical protein ACE366_26025 [Bradymonadia bacterium]
MCTGPRTIRISAKALAASLVTAGMLIAGSAAAQQPPPNAGQGEYVQDPNNPNVFYKKKTEYDFEDDVVEGSFVRPEGEFIDVRRGTRQSSLIKIRENFVPEMLKSAEDI